MLLIPHENCDHCKNELQNNGACADHNCDSGLLVSFAELEGELALDLCESDDSNYRCRHEGEYQEYSSHPPLCGHAVGSYPCESVLVAGLRKRLGGIVGLEDPQDSEQNADEVCNGHSCAEGEVVDHSPLAFANIYDGADKSDSYEENQHNALCEAGVVQPADND